MAALSKRDIEMIFRAETDAAQRPVKELSSDVTKLRQTLEDLAKSTGKTDKSLDTLAATTRELSKAQDELANARTLLTQLNAQATALERAENAAAAAGKKFEGLKAQVDGAEKPTKRLTTSLAAAERGMQATNARLDEQRKNYAETKTSIESIIGPVDNLDAAFRTVAVAQREITQGMAAAKGSVASFKAEITDTKVEAERLAQVDAFRKFAADSIAADSAAERIKGTLDGTSTSAMRLADAIQNIVNPAARAATTIDGMDARLDAVIAKMAGGKISVNEWNNLNNELVSIQANLVRVSAEVDRFTAQQAQVNSASQAYDAQRAKVAALAAAHVQADTNVEELTADLKREEGALTQLGTALDRETAKLKEMGTTLQRVGVNTNDLPNAIQRIESTATRAAPAIQKVSNAISPNGKKGFLGLDQFALQNLSYQVNDVFTSLASGAPPMQVFAQQSGQIAQIFPGIISGFVSWLPLILPVAAAVAVLAGAIGEANTQLDTLRAANVTLASLGDTNGYDAKKFQEIAKSFRDMGVSAEEATKSAKVFVTEGLNPAAVDDYVIAAKNLADVQGIDVLDATTELTKAFTAGATEVLALDDKYHFLTETQRTNLAASKDTKDEYNQVNKAFTQLYSKMQDGANAARGPMTDATNTLRAAWRGLLSTFADTGIITAVTNYLADAVLGFAFLINVAKRAVASFKGAGDAFAQGTKLGGPLIGAVFASAKIGQNIGEGSANNILSGALADTQAGYNQGRSAATRAQGNPGADAGSGSAGRQRDREGQAAKDRKQAARDAKKAAADAAAEAKRRQREAEQLAKQYENEQDQLTSALSRFTMEALKGQQAPLEQQLQFAKEAVDEQFKALEDRLQEFGTKFGANAKINGMSQSDYAANLNRQKQQIVLARQLGVYEDNVNDLMKSRSERLKQISEDQKAGLLSAQEAMDKTLAVTVEMGPQIDAAIIAAKNFIAALTPSNETQALLDKFARIQNQGGGGGNNTTRRTQAIAGVDQGEDEINKVFERRARLIAAANNLYEVGATNYSVREASIKAAYEATNQEITDGIAAARAYLEANKTMIPPEVFANATAALDVYNTKLKYTSDIQKTIHDTAEQAFAQGFTDMFNTLASGIAGLIDGTKSFGDVLSDLGRATLSFVANFAKAIADAIIQLYALRIAKSLVSAAGFHGGGKVGDYGGGQQVLQRNVGVGALNLSSVPRYHEGTAGAGLKSNEVMAILEKGEVVQTEEQQKAEKKRLDAARSGGGGGRLRQVLAFGDDEIAGAMAGPAGERVTVTHISRNKGQIRQELGLD